MVIVGRQLLADKYFPIVNRDQPNSEAMAADLIISRSVSATSRPFARRSSRLTHADHPSG
nr:P2 family phage major capsid protein [Enterobacter hormaechei]